MTDSPPSPPEPQSGFASTARAALDTSPARRFDRTPTTLERLRGTHTARAPAATRQSDRRRLVADTRSTLAGVVAPQPAAEFTFRAPAISATASTAVSTDASTAFPSLHEPEPVSQAPRREFVGTALLPALSRRATISDQKHASLRIGSPARGPGSRYMLDRNFSVASRAASDAGVAPHSSSHPSSHPSSLHAPASADRMSVDSAQATLTPASRGSYETPNDNENDGLYASEFWLNALVPKPHTNFFGYEASIGPICISISTRESHECYKALVRTPFKFGVVYVPTMVIDEPIFGTDLDRLSSPTPQKILLYHALRLYFQQADDERRGYLLTALRNRQLSCEAPASSVFAKAALAAAPDALWGRAVASAIKDVSETPSADSKPRRKRGLQRSSTKRSIELRRAEISDFMDSLFQPAAGSPGSGQRASGLRTDASIGASSATVDCADASDLRDGAMLAEIHSFLAAERSQRDLAVATESLTEIRDDHLKPLLRNLEPKLFRRRLRVDFVIVGATHQSQLDDMAAPHRRFLRTLERASARQRGDSGSAGDSLRPGDDSSSEQHSQHRHHRAAGRRPKHQQPTPASRRQKTREEMDEKRNNVIQELLDTERSYVEKLRALIAIYVVPLRSAARSANNALIPAYDAHVVFGNIERVSEVNERFLGDLEAWHRGEMDPKETIGSLCRDHFVDFHVYKRYINGYQHALATSRELEAKNALYAGFLQRAREREECRKLGISDLLIMPVQRIPRYTLLLSDLIKLIPDDDPDVARLQLALERVNEIGQLADNQVAESVAELHNIHTTIEGCPPNLISASREYIGAVDASEIDLATGAPKKPMSLLVFSDLLMIVERFWPPRDRSGIRVTGRATSRLLCPIHAFSAETGRPAAGTSSSASLGSNAASGAASGSSSVGIPASTAPVAQQQQQQQQQHQQHQPICTCSSSYSASSSAANAFLTTSSGSSNRKRWGRFAGWIDITRVSILEKSMSPHSRSLFIHRYPVGADDSQASATEASTARRQRTGTATPSANPKSLKSSGSSIISLDSSNTSSPVPGGSGQAAGEHIHLEFARILYPNETTYESYGDHGYWYPQSLHEFETDHPLSRDAFFEFLNTAWERSVARCFEASSSASLSRHGSNSGSGASAFAPRTRADTGSGGDGGSGGHRKTKSGVEDFAAGAAGGLGHPELDRVDVGGQAWTVRIWDAGDYARSRPACPSALAADMTVVWDYRHMGSPSQLIALDDSRRAPFEEPPGAAYYPLQACRVMDFGDDYFHVTSTFLPLDAQHAAAPDAFAELAEEREVADSWAALCRAVEQAITMYQYVLLAYPEHRRVQQCYNRSILASLFGQNALGSSSSVKPDAAAATPRKLFSRAKHLFSSGKQRGAPAPKESPDTANLFSSAYGNAVPADTVGPSSGSSPYNHSTISAPLTVLGRYKLKTKSSTMVSSRRAAPALPGQPAASPAKTLSAPVQPLEPFAPPRPAGSLPAGRKVSHTIDDFSSLAPAPNADPVELRVRSQTSWEHRARSTSNAQPFPGPPALAPTSQQLKRAVPVSPSPSGPPVFDSPILRIAGGEDTYTKRRSMSVVSAASAASARPVSMMSAAQSVFSDRPSLADDQQAAAAAIRANSLRPTASATSADSGLRSLNEDTNSEFSLQLLDLQPRSAGGLDIPSDLRLEFDEALGAANSSTPPRSTDALAILDLQQLSSSFSAPVGPALPTTRASNSGLNVLIPSSSACSTLHAQNTWDVRSPDHDSAAQLDHLPRSSAGSDASSSAFSVQTTLGSKPLASSLRGPSRRQGVYGAPLHSPIAVASFSAELLTDAKPHPMLSEADILLDIARELGQDEPFTAQIPNSPLYVDDDEIASHLGQTSVMRRSQTSPMLAQFDSLSLTMPSDGADMHSSRDSLRPLPLPPLPPHSKSLNMGTDRQKTLSSHSSAGRGVPAASSIYASAWTQQGSRSRIPPPPTVKYNLQQQTASPPASTSTDYRRLPSLPPRVRSTAASVYLDRSLNRETSSSSTERQNRPLQPPYQ